MNVEQTKFTIKNAPPRMSILIEADHGYGKSSVVAQTAAELSIETGHPYQFIDFRLSQKEVADLLGMMRSGDFKTTRRTFTKGKETREEISLKNVTFYDKPFWWPAEGTYGILFLDEMNRATRDVQQVVFELALDYRLNFNELPKGWRVVTAINQNMDVYSVTSIDPALYDRFLKIRFEPTYKDWLDWAKDNGVHPAVRQYITNFEKDLFPPANMESGKTYPSPRAWTKLSDFLNNMAKPFKDKGYLNLLAHGFVGSVAANFTTYIEKNYKVYKAVDILDRFGKIADDFKDMQAVESVYYTDILIEHIKEKMVLSKVQGQNLFAFVKTISKEAANAFWMKFSFNEKNGDNKLRELALKWMDEVGSGSYLTSIISKSQAMA